MNGWPRREPDSIVNVWKDRGSAGAEQTDRVDVDHAAYDSLHMKALARGGLAQIGLAFAAVGLSAGFYERARQFGTHGISIVPISVPWLLRRLNDRANVEEALALRVKEVAFDRRWEETG